MQALACARVRHRQLRKLTVEQSVGPVDREIYSVRAVEAYRISYGSQAYTVVYSTCLHTRLKISNCTKLVDYQSTSRQIGD